MPDRNQQAQALNVPGELMAHTKLTHCYSPAPQLGVERWARGENYSMSAHESESAADERI